MFLLLHLSRQARGGCECYLATQGLLKADSALKPTTAQVVSAAVGSGDQPGTQAQPALRSPRLRICDYDTAAQEHSLCVTVLGTGRSAVLQGELAYGSKLIFNLVK